MDNKRLFLAALLSVAVLLLWQTIFPSAPQPSREPSPEPRPIESPTGGAERGSSGFAAEPRDVGPPAGADADRRQETLGEELQEEIVAAAEREVVLESDRIRAIFSNRGAQLHSFVSKEHSNGSGGGVDLVKRRAEPPYPFAIVDFRGASDPLNDALFVVSEGAGTEEDPIRFEYSGASGRAEKSFWLRDDGMLGVRLSVAGRSDWSLLLGPGVRNPELEETESRFARRAAIYMRDQEVERLDARKTAEAERISGSGVSWIGLEDTYFLTGWVVTGAPFEYALVRPVSGRIAGKGEEAVFEVAAAPVEDDDGVVRELELLIAAGAEVLEGSAYLGAKQYDHLAVLPNGLQEAVNLGFFAILAKPILFGLRWLHHEVTGNWGWAIILMTVFIRLILFPLTHKSFVSMQKMQEVNPKIQAIKNKYRGKLKDKQGRPNTEMQRKMNEEVMGLYKKEGVNPAGGCLPMLLQIPVLFAFYNLLSAAVELRHAPWILWIQDLSAPDPFYALPIIMGASQFVQQRLTPAAADPMQRRIFMLMPFFFTFLFLGFPSGMVLYWLTNNVLGIAQQAGYKRLKESRAAKTKGDKK
ncbi:MAG: membrane protein insertase YidC [bacterium]|nr:membrane protein insertase YidC [bacterium]